MRGTGGEREVAHEGARTGGYHRDLPTRIGRRRRDGHIESTQSTAERVSCRRPRGLLDAVGGIWKLELPEDGLGRSGDEGEKGRRLRIVDGHEDLIRGIPGDFVGPELPAGGNRVDDRPRC